MGFKRKLLELPTAGKLMYKLVHKKKLLKKV